MSNKRTARSSARVNARSVWAGAFFCLAIGLSPAHANGEPLVPADFALSPYVGGLDTPTDIAWSPDGQLLFIAEKGGTVRIVDNGSLDPTPFVDLSAEVNRTSDRGLLGLALHPAFPSAPYIYLSYVYDPPETAGQPGAAGPDGNGQRVSRVVRFTADAATSFRTALSGSRLVLAGIASTWTNIGDPTADQIDLSAPWSCGPAGAYVTGCIPADGLSHSVGALAFGTDGSLYVGTGDAATWTTVDSRALRALDPDSLAGKILRIDPDTGAGLPDNPFWDGNAVSNRSKVFQAGLRNPFRFVIDTAGGKLWLGDVGWEAWEELNEGPAGADFGWPCFEGGDGVSLQTPGYSATAGCQAYYASNAAAPAAWAYPHDPQLGGALLPGAIRDGSSWPALYDGRLFVSDYAAATVRHVAVDGGAVDPQPFASNIVAVDLAFGPDNALYTVDVTAGVVYRIAHVGNTLPSATIAISHGNDDAEERSGGNVTVKSTRLEMTQASTNQLVGVRFRNVAVPNGGHVVSAFVQFTSAEASSDTTTLVIEGEASDNASPFAKSNFNLSSRPRTTTSRQWSPPPWIGAGLAGIDQRTPDLSALLNEIVSRPGWTAGNAVAFIVSGSGRRVAHAYNGQPALAAQLHLVWSDNPNTAPQVTILSPADGATVTQSTPVDFTGSVTDLEEDDNTLTAALDWVSDIDGSLGVGGSFQVSSMSIGVHTVTASVTDSGGATGQDTISLTVSTNTAPQAEIDAPPAGTQFAVGDIVMYSGTGSDAEDGTLPGSALTWDGSVVHNSHEHPDFLSATGSSGSFAYPDHDDNAFVRLCLTATDSAGASASDCLDLLPQEALYTFDSVPSGLLVAYNGLLQSTPFNVQATVGGTRQITTPSPQTGFYFQNWNIGGNQTQQIVIGQANQVVSASFDSAPLVAITAPADGALVVPGDPVTFTANVSDVEDDDAALGAQLAWVSDLDGPIGTGVSFQTATMSSGTHLVTASVTDSAGLTGQDQVSLTVGAVPDWVAVASYQADFSANSPSGGWSYLWNRDAAVGNSAGYVPVFWNGVAYDSDGNAGLPDATELRYGQLNASGGHSGQGVDQGAAADRYVIAAWSPTNSASYRVALSTVTMSGCQWSNGLDVRVYSNDTLVRQVAVAAGATAVGFDADVGALTLADQIFVAVGPAGKDGCDSFSWDYTIEQATGGQPPNTPPDVTNPGDQSHTTADTVSLQIVATDADNDPLSFTLSGAPPGLVINGTTGLITGTPTATGTFSTSVDVSDGTAVSSVSFIWTITSAGQTWSQVAAFAEDFAVPPAPGWRYQWNAGGPIGTAAGYVDLAFNGSAYDSDGVAGLPDASELAYGRLHGSGGHTGRAVIQGAGSDRYVIAGFAAPTGGEFRIVNSSVSHSGCQWTDGFDVRVYVGDALQTQRYVAGGGAADFDLPLGALGPGDIVYVAAGPSTRDGCDAFSWDFTIERAD